MATIGTDIFLTHDWGKDEHQRDNHSRVNIINDALKKKGYITWFDQDRMQGSIPNQMATGIQNTNVVLTFITAHKKTYAKMVAIVMEQRMKTASLWNGTLGLYLGNKLYVDMSGDLDNVQYLQNQLALLCKEISCMGEIPRSKYHYHFMDI